MNGRVLRQVVSRLIRRSAAPILTECLEGEITIGDPNQPRRWAIFCLSAKGIKWGARSSKVLKGHSHVPLMMELLYFLVLGLFIGMKKL